MVISTHGQVLETVSWDIPSGYNHIYPIYQLELHLYCIWVDPIRIYCLMLILAQIWSCFELLRVSRQNNLIIGSGYPRWRNTHVASKVTNTNCQLAASTNVHMHYVLARKNQIICQHLLKIFKSIYWDPKNIPRDLPVPWSVLPCGFLWEQGKPRTSFPYWGAIFIWGPHPPFFERGRRSCRWVYIPWYSHITSTSSKPPWKIAIKSPWNPHKFKHHFSAPWISKRSHTMNFDGEIGWSFRPFHRFRPGVLRPFGSWKTCPRPTSSFRGRRRGPQGYHRCTVVKRRRCWWKPPCF